MFFKIIKNFFIILIILKILASCMKFILILNKIQKIYFLTIFF